MYTLKEATQEIIRQGELIIEQGKQLVRKTKIINSLLQNKLEQTKKYNELKEENKVLYAENKQLRLDIEKQKERMSATSGKHTNIQSSESNKN